VVDGDGLLGLFVREIASTRGVQPLSSRLRACERIVAESADRAERRAAAAEISQILRHAEAATA
jgi:hypothetical protein